MALYRHNATGFLGEFATNPGAGYTAISAMPTDTVANRVTWWRELDTYGQTSSWHPSVTRDAQDPGEATISIQFSQDIALISSEPDGTITNPRDPTNAWYVGATTEVRVYRGITDVTISEGWTLTKVEEGCTSTLTETGGLYTLKITDIPLLATNAGYIRITATREGSGEFVKDFRFLKVFQGQDGSSGIVLDLDNENQTVAAAKDGTWIAGTTATTTARLYLGATQLTSGITWSVQSATTGITYSSTNNTSSYTVSVTGMTAALTSGTITIAAVYNGVTYTQAFTISKANAGADGTPATVYWLQTSASAIAKDAAGTYNPTSFTVAAYSQTGTNAVAAYTGRFVIQTQATLNGGWTTRYTSAGNESSTTYNVPASIVAIRVYLYQAGGTTTLLDQETLPVVADGQPGTPGTAGERGSRQIVITGTSNWSDATAWNGILNRFGGTAPVLSDLVTIVNTSAGTSTSKFYTGGAFDGNWETVTEYINGNLLVTGTVGANAIAANAITTGKIAAGAITADKLSTTYLAVGSAAGDINAGSTTISGSKITTGTLAADKITSGNLTASWIALTANGSTNAHIASSNFVSGSQGFVIRSDGWAEFNNVDIRGRLRAGDINSGTLSVDRIATNSINGIKIGTGYNGVGTTNLVPGAVSWATTASAYDWVTPTFYVWQLATTVSVPANTNRGPISLNITLTAKNGWTSKYYVNIRVSRTGLDKYAAVETNGCLDSVSLAATDTSPPTGAFTYSIYVKYGKVDPANENSFNRVIGGTFLELKR